MVKLLKMDPIKNYSISKGFILIFSTNNKVKKNINLFCFNFFINFDFITELI